MLQKSIGTFFITLWVFVFAANTQAAVPWTITSNKTSSHTITINPHIPTVEGNNTTFAIGAFYDSLGYSKCAGYGIWPTDNSFIIYGGDGSNMYGYKPGSTFRFKIWNIETSCELDSVQIYYTPATQSTFIDGGNTGIDSINAWNSIFSYPSNHICQNGDTVSAIIYGGGDHVKYTAPPGLALDSNGKIYPNVSTAGDYIITAHTATCLVNNQFYVKVYSVKKVELTDDSLTICDNQRLVNAGPGWDTYNWNTGNNTQTLTVVNSGIYSVVVTDTNGCKSSDTIDVTILASMYKSLQFSITDATCGDAGKIIIDTSTISGGASPFTYFLNPVKKGPSIESSSSIISDIPEGTYALSIMDGNKCKIEVKNNISINRNPCEYPLLVFDNSGKTQGYYIDHQGIAKVYDKSGKVLKSLTVPAVWDGTNENGEIVAMGDYLIICNESIKIMVTVFK